MLTPPHPLQHHFVEFVPEELAEGHLYVSLAYGTVVHLCCCGCGEQVVPPLTPKDWQLTYDGESVSLSPSIGNWSFACRSHYWIRRGRVVWARKWTDREVAAARSGKVSRIETPSEPARTETKSGRLEVIRRQFSRLLKWVRTSK